MFFERINAQPQTRNNWQSIFNQIFIVRGFVIPALNFLSLGWKLTRTLIWPFGKLGVAKVKVGRFIFYSKPQKVKKSFFFVSRRPEQILLVIWVFSHNKLQSFNSFLSKQLDCLNILIWKLQTGQRKQTEKTLKKSKSGFSVQSWLSSEASFNFQRIFISIKNYLGKLFSLNIFKNTMFWHFVVARSSPRLL